jgi:hypothetical protein
LEKNARVRPEHLFAGVQKLQTASGQVSWLLHRRFKQAAIFTVARPRGIFTRFPYSSRSTRDTRTHLKEPGT